MERSTVREPEIERDRRTPLYVQIREMLLAELQSEDGGDRMIFSDAALMRRFNVSRMTVRSAVAELVREGVVERIPGRGTFLRQAAHHSVALDGLERFLQEWHLPHLRTRVPVFRRRALPPPDVAARLQIDAAARVLAIERLREDGDEPCVLDLRFVPAWCAGGITRRDAARQSLFVTMAERSGLEAQAVEQEIGAEVAGDDLAARLKIAPGTALLRRVVTFYTADERPIITGTSYYRSDRFTFQVRASRRAEQRAMLVGSSARRRAFGGEGGRATNPDE